MNQGGLGETAESLGGSPDLEPCPDAFQEFVDRSDRLGRRVPLCVAELDSDAELQRHVDLGLDLKQLRNEVAQVLDLAQARVPLGPRASSGRGRALRLPHLHHRRPLLLLAASPNWQRAARTSRGRSPPSARRIALGSPRPRRPAPFSRAGCDQPDWIVRWRLTVRWFAPPSTLPAGSPAGLRPRK